MKGDDTCLLTYRVCMICFIDRSHVSVTSRAQFHKQVFYAFKLWPDATGMYATGMYGRQNQNHKIHWLNSRPRTKTKIPIVTLNK